MNEIVINMSRWFEGFNWLAHHGGPCPMMGNGMMTDGMMQGMMNSGMMNNGMMNSGMMVSWVLSLAIQAAILIVLVMLIVYLSRLIRAQKG